MTEPAAAVYGFPRSGQAAFRLAEALGLPFLEVALHRFPDGESLVRAYPAAERAIVYRSLDRPNEKLVELMLTASALRDGGTRHITLVAPYLCYMRQDIAFNPGEAVSQRVVGRFLGELFDLVATVEPHLHRTRSLARVFGATPALVIGAAPQLAQRLEGDRVGPDTVLVGPDVESRPLVEGVARALGLEWLIGRKSRSGDRDVDVEIDDLELVEGRPVVLLDDVVASGVTLIACARHLLAAGAASLEALVVHALCGPDVEAALRAAGIGRLRSTDSVPHPTNAVELAPLIARALRERGA